MAVPNLQEDLCEFTLNDLGFFIGTLAASATAVIASIFSGIRRSRCTQIKCLCITCLREVPDEIELDTNAPKSPRTPAVGRTTGRYVPAPGKGGGGGGFNMRNSL